MMGLGLPKLRWLLIGAVAAGGWAMTQEPPRHSAPRLPAAARQADLDPRPEVRPAARLPPATTGTVGRADRPLARTLYTRERVRLRADPSTGARVVDWLDAGERLFASARSGLWHRVSASGRQGWVHGDYLAAADPSAPRPRAALAAPTPAARASVVPIPEARHPPGPPALTTASRTPVPLAPVADRPVPALPLSRRPSRAPQQGDCQCPYDLMISGKQCGDRSAYVMRGRASTGCYL